MKLVYLTGKRLCVVIYLLSNDENLMDTSPNVAAKCSNKDSVAPQKATAQMLRKGKIKRKWTLVHQ